MKKNPLLKKILFLCCLFTFSYIGGTSIRYLVNQNQVSQTAASQEGNWGLSFQEEGAAPVGNASCDELSPYHAA